MTGQRDPLAVRAYRRALVLLPRRFRRERGDAMVAMLVEEWRDRSGFGRPALVVRAFLDLAWTAVAERLDGGAREHWAPRGWPRFSWLDFKVGLRMMARYPGLTLVGGLALAFAIALGTAFFQFVSQFVYPSLPFEDGERIVALRQWDVEAGRERVVPHDLILWREGLRSVEELGAFRTRERNLLVGTGPNALGEPVQVAEISASAFRLTRVPPLRGRFLVDADERPGAPDVVVIGHDLWTTRFGADPDVIGQVVRLGSARATVVGVMPEGYLFPFAHHIWSPLRVETAKAEPGRGPSLTRVFGRLAPGLSLEEAQIELETIGQRSARNFPDTHQHAQPRVHRYAQWIDLSSGLSAAVMSSNLLAVTFLLLVGANVALLMFARAATREAEMLVRSALGASRGRIVMQLFAEALVLGGAAALIGVAAAGLTLEWGMRSLGSIESELPFWFRWTLSPTSVAYGAALAVVAALVAGVIPALKVTGRRLETHLRRSTGGGVRFGGLWTAVIVTQVAVTFAVPIHAWFVIRQTVGARSAVQSLPLDEVLTARLELDDAPESGGDEPPVGRRQTTFRELEAALEREAGVLGVTFADVLPTMPHAHEPIEVEGLGPGGHAMPPRARLASVAPDFFEAFDARLLAGRPFDSGDLAPDARVVIVNRSFAEQVLEGRNAVGVRVRYSSGGGATVGDPQSDAATWYEIVGVVEDLGMATGEDTLTAAGMYRPAAPETLSSVRMAARVRGKPAELSPRVRSLVSSVDPELRLHDLQPLERVRDGHVRWLSFLFWITTLVSGVAVVLALAGVYAVTSFTVSRRTREIGVRVALGAEPRRLLPQVFRRPLTQLGAGVALGAMLALLVALAEAAELGSAELSPKGLALMVAHVTLMTAVCLLACVVPARRALRVEPSEALRAEG